MNSPQWQTQLETLRRDQRMPLALSVFFGFLLLLALGQLINTFTTHHIKTTATPTDSTITQPYHLAELHLFGVYTASLDALPDSTLQLTLEGTAVDLDNPSTSRAMISTPGQSTKVYQVGNTLPGNATITRIAKHYVVVNDNGALEKLQLPIETISP